MLIKEKALFLRHNFLPDDLPCHYGHVYFGDEFCERCLPSISDLENIHKHESYRRLKFTLVTPYLTNDGIKKLTQIIGFIEKEKFSMQEIVINDWGALKLVRDCGNEFQVILGRILVSRYLKEEHLTMFAKRGARNRKKMAVYNFFPDSFLDFIKKENIISFEFNSYYHLAATRPQLINSGLKIHIYWPYIYLTTSRYCSSVAGFNSYFRKSIEGCDEDCQNHIAIITNEHYPNRIFIKGNALFIQQEDSLKVFDDLEVDRVIYNDFSIKGA